MSKNILQKNISYLAVITQTKLAEKIDMQGINQRKISDVARGKRGFSVDTIREIERKLAIPAGWLDRYPFNHENLRERLKYQQLNKESKLLFDELSLYMISQENKDENH